VRSTVTADPNNSAYPLLLALETGHRLVINRGQGANVAEELVEEGGIDVFQSSFIRKWLLRENDGLGTHGIRGKQAPVDEGAISEIRVVNGLGSPHEHCDAEMRKKGLEEAGRQRERGCWGSPFLISSSALLGR